MAADALIDTGAILALLGRTGDRHDSRKDFADATLVYLAKCESVANIPTVDQVDFATCHIEGKRRFRILPQHALLPGRNSVVLRQGCFELVTTACFLCVVPACKKTTAQRPCRGYQYQPAAFLRTTWLIP
jgi:hypothetical protein